MKDELMNDDTSVEKPYTKFIWCKLGQTFLLNSMLRSQLYFCGKVLMFELLQSPLFD